MRGQHRSLLRPAKRTIKLHHPDFSVLSCTTAVLPECRGIQPFLCVLLALLQDHLPHQTLSCIQLHTRTRAHSNHKSNHNNDTFQRSSKFCRQEESRTQAIRIKTAAAMLGVKPARLRRGQETTIVDVNTPYRKSHNELCTTGLVASLHVQTNCTC